MTTQTKKSFKLNEQQWSESLRLATATEKQRDAWWLKLGEELGFVPTTVDWLRPTVFEAVVADSPRSAPPAKKQPYEPVPARSKAPKERAKKPATKPPDDVECPIPGGKQGNKLVGAKHEPATVVFTEDRKLAMLDQCGCARCGKSHRGITYRKLKRPITLAGESLTHWAFCPTTGEPILMSIQDVAVGDVRVPGELDDFTEKPESRAAVLKEKG